MYHYNYLKCFTAVLVSAVINLSSFAQDKATAKRDEKQPNEAEMTAMMMEMSKPGENHKLLASLHRQVG
jgi:hypothetical protein